MKVDPKLVREWEAKGLIEPMLDPHHRGPVSLPKGLIETLAARAVRPRMHYIRLPLPPSTNNLFASVVIAGRPRRVKTKQYKDWIAAGEKYLLERRLATMPSPVRLIIAVVGKVSRARDLGNFEKATTDLLVSCGVIEGDSLMHVRNIVLSYEPSEEPGEVIVSVFPVTA